MSDKWELYYWPVAGRGEFIRLIFEEAGIPYTDISDVSVIKDVVMQGKLPGYPGFAPPVIKKGKTEEGQIFI
jgi:glutathione S-transferase